MNAFDECLPIILSEEGGYADLAHDPGGETNLGVTQAVWSAWVGHSASEAEMQALTVADVTPLYQKQFWGAASCDQLPPPLALCVFDFAVNGGVGRAVRYLQQMVNVPQDGHCGPMTLQAVQQYVSAKGVKAAVDAYQSARAGFYRDLPTFQYFGNGWLARVNTVEDQAEAMA